MAAQLGEGFEDLFCATTRSGTDFELFQIGMLVSEKGDVFLDLGVRPFGSLGSSVVFKEQVVFHH